MQLQKYLGPDVSIWKHCKSGTKACRKSMSYIFFPTQAWEKIQNLQLYLHQSAQLLWAKLKRPAEASSVWRICFNTHPNHAGLLHFTLAFEPAAIVAATYYGFFPQICQVFFFVAFWHWIRASGCLVVTCDRNRHKIHGRSCQIWICHASFRTEATNQNQKNARFSWGTSLF